MKVTCPIVENEERRGSTFFPSAKESETRAKLAQLYEQSPIPPDSRLEHLELFMRPQRVSEIVSLDAIYQRILNVHGVIIEFGVRWGRHLPVFIALRTRYEPHNLYRKIVGFDTFEGFGVPNVEDGPSARVHTGAMSVSRGYERYLEEVLTLHEQEAPASHIRRFELVKGDAPVALSQYLAEHPESIIALAYFDMDVYRPTKECLQLIGPHLAKGGVLAFDQISHPDFPGETLALKESAWFSGHVLERFPYAPYPTFITV
jgi:hypothetical protein